MASRLFPSSLLAAFYVPEDYHPASPRAYLQPALDAATRYFANR